MKNIEISAQLLYSNLKLNTKPFVNSSSATSDFSKSFIASYQSAVIGKSSLSPIRSNTDSGEDNELGSFIKNKSGVTQDELKDLEKLDLPLQDLVSILVQLYSSQKISTQNKALNISEEPRVDDSINKLIEEAYSSDIGANAAMYETLLAKITGTLAYNGSTVQNTNTDSESRILEPVQSEIKDDEVNLSEFKKLIISEIKQVLQSDKNDRSNIIFNNIKSQNVIAENNVNKAEDILYKIIAQGQDGNSRINISSVNLKKEASLSDNVNLVIHENALSKEIVDIVKGMESSHTKELNLKLETANDERLNVKLLLDRPNFHVNVYPVDGASSNTQDEEIRLNVFKDAISEEIRNIFDNQAILRNGILSGNMIKPEIRYSSSTANIIGVAGKVNPQADNLENREEIFLSSLANRQEKGYSRNNLFNNTYINTTDLSTKNKFSANNLNSANIDSKTPLIIDDKSLIINVDEDLNITDNSSTAKDGMNNTQGVISAKSMDKDIVNVVRYMVQNNIDELNADVISEQGKELTLKLSIDKAQSTVNAAFSENSPQLEDSTEKLTAQKLEIESSISSKKRSLVNEVADVIRHINAKNLPNLIDHKQDVSNQVSDIYSSHKGNEIIQVGNAAASKKSYESEKDKIENDSFSSMLNNINQNKDTLNKIEIKNHPTVNKETLVQDIVKSVKYMDSNSMKELTVKLSPKELGDMVISITMEAGQMKASISAHNKETYNLLAANISEIKNFMQDSNIKIHDVNISIYNGDTTFFGGGSQNENFNQQQFFRSSNEHNKQAEDDVEQQDIGKVMLDNQINILA